MKNHTSLFYMLLSLLFLSSCLINHINCLYVLPIKTTYDYDKKDITDPSKIMHNFLTNNIYTELDIGKPSQKLATMIKSNDYCSYIGANLCNIEKSNYDSKESEYFERITPYNLTFNTFKDVCLANEKMNFSTNYKKPFSSLEEVNLKQFYHAPNNSYSSQNPYTCGVFGFKYRFDENIEGENKCTNLMNSIYNKTNDNMKNLVFSIKYSESDDDIDGKLILGEYPHEYDSKKYDKKDYKQADLTIDNNNDFHTIFNEIYFYINNQKGNDSAKVTIYKLDQLHTKFILEQNMFMVPTEFFNFYKNYFFYEYIQIDACYITAIDLSRYTTIICDKNKIKSLDDFYDKFPTAYFFHFDFNTTFEFESKDLLIEEGDNIYFMMYIDNNNKENMWGIGKIFMEKYLLTFDYTNKSIGYYYGTDENEVKTFDLVKNGFYVLLILGANILVIFSCALYAIINKCTKSKVDPTIMIESFSNKNEKLQEKEEGNIL